MLTLAAAHSWVEEKCWEKMGKKKKTHHVMMTFVLMSWAGPRLAQGLLCRALGAVGGQVCFATSVWAVLIPWQKGIFSYSVLLKLCSWLFAGRRKGVIVVL